MTYRRVVLVAVVTALTFGFSCGDDDESDTTTTTSTPSATSLGVTTTAASPGATSTKPPPATTTGATIAPATPDFGDDCQLGGLPDCIDPDGDGQGTYLKGGAACMANLPSAPELCSDLDGDGTAGYPDSG